MGWINTIVLLILGVLGAAGIIVKKKPDAKELLEKLSKISGYVGVLGALWGIWIIISSILNLGWIGLGLVWLIWWITFLANGVAMAALGIIFGFGLISNYLGEEAKAKGEEIRKKLVGYQATLGIFSICVAIWNILFQLVIWNMLL